MSNRTLIEINHDMLSGLGEDFLYALRRYLRSADRQTAKALEPYGVRVLGMRHHSGQFIIEGEQDGFPVQRLPRAVQHDR